MYNNGSKNITQFDVTIIAPDGSIVQNSISLVGESQKSLSPIDIIKGENK